MSGFPTSGDLDASWANDRVHQPIWQPDEEDTRRLLAHGQIVACKPIPWGSNHTFAVGISMDGEAQTLAIYKPRSGETPLRDFPHGTLYRREYAAFVLSRLLGWPFVPATVIRQGPHGVGSVQLYVEPEPRAHFSRFKNQHPEELKRFVAFDLVANNADRKSIHVLKGTDGKLWGIDHGLTFNAWPKLRTVIWDFCGEPIPEDVRAAIGRLCDDPKTWMAVKAGLGNLLSAAEIDALRQRIERLLESGTFPILDPYRNVPFEWF